MRRSPFGCACRARWTAWFAVALSTACDDTAPKPLTFAAAAQALEMAAPPAAPKPTPKPIAPDEFNRRVEAILAVEGKEHWEELGASGKATLWQEVAKAGGSLKKPAAINVAALAAKYAEYDQAVTAKLLTTAEKQQLKAKIVGGAP
jgi:hypothetical protein